MENNNHAPGWVQQAREEGWRQCLLDIYVYLSGSEQLLDLDPGHLALIESMVSQADEKFLALATTSQLPVETLSH